MCIRVEQAELYCTNTLVTHEITVWAECGELQLNVMNSLAAQKTNLGKFSRQDKYFWFVSGNKIPFWNVIVVVSLAKWKMLQNHKMYYFRKQAPAFLFWRKNFFIQKNSAKTVISAKQLFTKVTSVMHSERYWMYHCSFMYWKCCRVHNGWQR